MEHQFMKQNGLKGVLGPLGLYSTDTSDLYMSIQGRYTDENYFKARVTLYYKSTNMVLERINNVKLYYTNIAHLTRYTPKRSELYDI